MLRRRARMMKTFEERTTIMRKFMIFMNFRYLNIFREYENLLQLIVSLCFVFCILSTLFKLPSRPLRHNKIDH